MTTMLEKKGTCPACMGEFHLYDKSGKIVVGRHGWTEVGGRQVGHYGLASHVGECFGVGWAPFEISPEGTWAYLSQMVFPTCLGAIEFSERLKTFPSLFIERRKEGTRETEFVEVTPENAEGCKRTGYSKKTVYEVAHANKVAENDIVFRQAFRVGSELTALALAWEPRDVKDAPPEGPTVHFKKEGARLPFCGARSHGLSTTHDESKVTCSRCQKALATSKRDQAVRDAIAADADTVVALLSANGPQTKAQIKKALDWDTKRVNKAIDRAEWGSGLIGAPRERRVTHDYDYAKKGPDKYRLTTEEEKSR